jgi:hypothetical protein
MDCIRRIQVVFTHKRSITAKVVCIDAGLVKIRSINERDLIRIQT